MTLARMFRPVAALAVALSLTACSNEKNELNGMTILRQLPQLIANRNAPPPQITPQQMNAVLQSTSGPVVMIQTEDTGAQGLMIRIEQNGPYQTFGNDQRQAVVFRNGMMTSTRGLGGDLMSSDVGPLLAKISARSEGNPTYLMRFLTPEDRTQALYFRCGVTRGDTIAVASGVINTSGTVMNASCTGDDGTTFRNTYLVSPNGNILSARQWMGPTIGYIAAQFLRM